MRTRLEIDGHELVITRDSFSGELAYRLDGIKSILQQVMSIDAQFSFNGNLEYSIPVGSSVITVVHDRPRIFAALRDHTFTIYKDGQQIKVVKGR